MKFKTLVHNNKFVNDDFFSHDGLNFTYQDRPKIFLLEESIQSILQRHERFLKMMERIESETSNSLIKSEDIYKKALLECELKIIKIEIE